jgi:phenylpropionate dioxygenase-like ring-hydroxylating dioxygenase large terminal subunit
MPSSATDSDLPTSTARLGLGDGPDFADLAQETRVHSAVYTDERVFEAELQRIFGKTWIYVGHESEVPEAGDYRLRQIGRRPVIMIRAKDGVVNVLFNRCRHRGATVCQEDAGKAKQLQCWFHGWVYGLDGKLVAVPDVDAYGPGFDKSAYDLARPARVASYREFVFASLSAEGPGLIEHLGPARELIDLMVDASPISKLLVDAGVQKTVFRGNWKLVGMDGYHAPFVHASVFGIFKKKADQGTGATHSADHRNIVTTIDLGHGHAAIDHRVARQRDPERYYKVLETTAGGSEYIQRMRDTYGARAELLLTSAGDPHVGLFPNVQLIGNQIRVVVPIAADRTEVLAFPVRLGGVSDEINAHRLRVHESFFGPSGLGTPDDVEVFERAQRGMLVEEAPWIDISRGKGREVRQPDGTIVGHMTDEVPQRGQFRAWRALMAGAK